MNPEDFNKINSNHDKFKNESIHWLKENGFIVK